MTENRKLIDSDKQGRAIEIMLRFKRIHEQIAVLEKQMDTIKESKELLLDELEMARTDDQFYQAQLEAAYGPGKLDATTLEWINKTDDDDNKDI